MMLYGKLIHNTLCSVCWVKDIVGRKVLGQVILCYIILNWCGVEQDQVRLHYLIFCLAAGGLGCYWLKVSSLLLSLQFMLTMTVFNLQIRSLCFALQFLQIMQCTRQKMQSSCLQYEYRQFHFSLVFYSYVQKYLQQFFTLYLPIFTYPLPVTHTHHTELMLAFISPVSTINVCIIFLFSYQSVASVPYFIAWSMYRTAYFSYKSLVVWGTELDQIPPVGINLSIILCENKNLYCVYTILKLVFSNLFNTF